MRRLVLLPILLAGLAASGSAADPGSALVEAQRQAAEAALRAQRLDEEAQKAGGEAARARAASEALVARIEAAEAEITAAEAKLRLIDRQRQRQRARLAERQAPLVALTAALQTMARRPQGLALVQPGSIDEMVRVRALLASAAPAIGARTAALRAEIEAGDRLRQERQGALQALATRRSALAERRVALARLEERELQRSEEFGRSALAQSERSVALAEEARDLAGAMQGSAAKVRLARELSALAGPVPRPGERIASSRSASRYMIPVQGRLVTGFGELSEAGIHSRGLSLDASPGALVLAPRAGIVAYAGRFRSYGEVVILDHGGGWTTTLTNLSALRVSRGDQVAAGAALGRARGGGTHLGVELRHQGRPQSIASFVGGS